MARFNFNLGGYVVQVRKQAVVSLRTERILDMLADECMPEEEKLTRGPDWFDPSWELVRGLEVREGLPGDVDLNEWLAVCLRNDRRPASRALDRAGL
jgi:hypothetical protein